MNSSFTVKRDCAKARIRTKIKARSNLIDCIPRRFSQLQLKDAEESVKTILGAILSKGVRAEIRGFGSFALNYRPPRNGRNPKTGVNVKVPAKYVPHFKVGKELRERVNYK